MNKTMRVLFDGTSCQGIVRGKISFHGGAEYAKFILYHAIDMGYEFDVVINDNRFTDEATQEWIRKMPSKRVHHVKNRKEIYKLLEVGGYDRFYSPLPHEYTDYHSKTQLLAVIHGLRRIELPWDYYKYKFLTNPIEKVIGYCISNSKQARHFMLKREVRKFTHIMTIPNAKYVTVSNHSKYSILHFFPHIKKEDLEVFYSPFSVEIQPRHDHDNYFLMVSGDRFEKNVLRAVMAFDRLISKGQLTDKKVVVTGCVGNTLERMVKNKEAFQWLPYVSKKELEDLYRRAFCFVYPSLNEGFGYPPLISMAGGVPVIASSATSIPEACGDAAIYFDPLNINDLSNRILQITNEEKLRAALTAKGYKRVQELLETQASSLKPHLDFIFIKP